MGTAQHALAYFTARQCPLQWRGFLAATAGELSARFEPADLRAIMHGIGTRFAADIELADSNDVPAIARAMNAVWHTLDWGWVDIEEKDGAVRLSHHLAPLRAAFGEGAQTWTPAFLEGAYQAWFRQLGASDPLHVRQLGEADEDGALHFRFGR